MLRGSFICTKESERTTLAEAWDRYLKEITPTKKGAKRERSRIMLLQKSTLGCRYLASVRGVDIATYRDARLKEVSPRTVQVEMATISHLFTICRKEWGMEYLTNPVMSVRSPKVNNARDRRFCFGEEDVIREHLNPEMNAVITIAIETAMRRSEIASLRWDMIRGDVVTLKETKNGTVRHVPLSSVAKKTLSALPRREDGRVFGLYIDDMTHRFKAACNTAGVEGMRFHDLRHEATSRLFERGFSIMEVASITGHKSLAMLQRYTHIAASDLAKRLG
ncbi:MAG: hypothetical protein CTY16_15835 [Methylobacter sp.]|nr:MAG: hypothetical protein CTY16_15835 [Methylobacter sp.]